MDSSVQSVEMRPSNGHSAKLKRLTEFGTVFVLAILANTLFFDKSFTTTGQRDKKRGGGVGGAERKKKKKRDPFESRALSLEKGRLSGMIHRLDSTLASTPSSTISAQVLVA